MRFLYFMVYVFLGGGGWLVVGGMGARRVYFALLGLGNHSWMKSWEKYYNSDLVRDS